MQANGAEQIICLGDVVGYGPFPGECLDLVQRCGAVLMGNHEEALLFGAESHGLSNDELALCQLPVMIPARPIPEPLCVPPDCSMSRRAMNPSTTAAMPTGIDRKNEKNKQAISETTPDQTIVSTTRRTPG